MSPEDSTGLLDVATLARRIGWERRALRLRLLEEAKTRPNLVHRRSPRAPIRVLLSEAKEIWPTALRDDPENDAVGLRLALKNLIQAIDAVLRQL